MNYSFQVNHHALELGSEISAFGHALLEFKTSMGNDEVAKTIDEDWTPLMKAQLDAIELLENMGDTVRHLDEAVEGKNRWNPERLEKLDGNY